MMNNPAAATRYSPVIQTAWASAMPLGDPGIQRPTPRPVPPPEPNPSPRPGPPPTNPNPRPIEPRTQLPTRGFRRRRDAGPLHRTAPPCSRISGRH
jgi:hypothetical protein